MTEHDLSFTSRLPPAEFLRRFVHLAAARLNPGVADPLDPVGAPFTVRESRNGVVVFATRPVSHLSRYAYRGEVSARADGASQLRFRRERMIRMTALGPQWKIGIAAQAAALLWLFWTDEVPASQLLLTLGLVVAFFFVMAFVATAAFEDGRSRADVEARTLEATLRSVASELGEH